jgi:hypothetical protein
MKAVIRYSLKLWPFIGDQLCFLCSILSNFLDIEIRQLLNFYVFESTLNDFSAGQKLEKEKKY